MNRVDPGGNVAPETGTVSRMTAWPRAERSWENAAMPSLVVPNDDDVLPPAGALPTMPPTSDAPNSMATTAATTNSTARHRFGTDRHRSVASGSPA